MGQKVRIRRRIRKDNKSTGVMTPKGQIVYGNKVSQPTEVKYVNGRLTVVPLTYYK